MGWKGNKGKRENFDEKKNNFFKLVSIWKPFSYYV